MPRARQQLRRALRGRSISAAASQARVLANQSRPIRGAPSCGRCVAGLGPYWLFCRRLRFAARAAARSIPACSAAVGCLCCPQTLLWHAHNGPPTDEGGSCWGWVRLITRTTADAGLATPINDVLATTAEQAIKSVPIFVMLSEISR